jgi:hypothetical protein
MESIELKVKNRNHRSSAAIRAEIESAPLEARHSRNIYLAAELDATEAERFVVCHAILFRGGDYSDVIDNNRGMYLKLGDRLTTATAARNLANLLASAPEVIEARAMLDPLYTELDAAQAREQIEAAGAARAFQGVVEATAQARADLEAQIEQHPLVLEATKKALPYHRKGELIGV